MTEKESLRAFLTLQPLIVPISTYVSILLFGHTQALVGRKSGSLFVHIEVEVVCDFLPPTHT